MNRSDLVLLMTRPEAASRQFLAGLSDHVQHSVTPVLSPLIEITPVRASWPHGTPKGVIFSSANGVRSVDRTSLPTEVPAYCVGAKTTDVARRAGWAAQMSGQTARSLVDALILQKPDGPIWHLHGRHTRGQIAQSLTQAGVPTHGVVVYDQIEQPLSKEAMMHLNASNPVIVPLFSPRSARLFAVTCRHTAPLHVLALSDAVAQPLATLALASIRISLQPTAHAMHAALNTLVEDAWRVEGERPSK